MRSRSKMFLGIYSGAHFEFKSTERRIKFKFLKAQKRKEKRILEHVAKLPTKVHI